MVSILVVSPIRFMTKLRLTKERIIVLLILLIPLSGTFAVMAPMPAEFVLRGQTVPVSDIGINGSVHFVYVESGITNNLLERWSVYLRYRRDRGEIEFTSIVISSPSWKDTTETRLV